jgi:hypothetical protein
MASMHATRPTHPVLPVSATLIIFGEENKLKKSLLCSFTALLFFPSLRSKYSSQHCVLRHPQSVFVPQCQRPSFTPTWNTER